MSFTQSIASARAFQKHGEPEPDANQEILALGMANIGGGLLQAMPSGGGTYRPPSTSSPAPRRSWPRSPPLAGACDPVLLAPLISLMPQATLGALVLMAAAGLIKVSEFQKIARISKRELIWALVAFAGVVLLGTLQGILVAVALSLLILSTRPTTRPSMRWDANRAPISTGPWSITRNTRPCPACWSCAPKAG